jgi:post-segregation antitoxin (ccd killing protein)
MSVYVAYLKYRPAETIINDDLLQDLRDENVDVSLLTDWTADRLDKNGRSFRTEALT